MKKIMITILAGVMIAMMILTGCGLDNKSERKSKDCVDVDVEVTVQNGWVKTVYIYKSDNKSAARRLCEEKIYEHLDEGYTVSEMIETSDDNGDTIYKFTTWDKINVAG